MSIGMCCDMSKSICWRQTLCGPALIQARSLAAQRCLTDMWYVDRTDFLVCGHAYRMWCSIVDRLTGGCGNRFCLQLNGSFPCGKAIRVSRYFLRLAWVLHDGLKVARLNLAATSMGIPVYQWKLLYIIRCCPDSHFCHDLKTYNI